MKINLLLIFSGFIFLSACSIQVDSKLYADKSTSLELYMTMNQLLVDQIMPKESLDTMQILGKNINDFANGWSSFYNLAVQNDTLLMNANLFDADSIRFLKLLEMKVDIEQGNFKGFGMRMSRASEEDQKKFLQLFKDAASETNLEQAEQSASGMDINWDGKKLIIATETGQEKQKNEQDEEMDQSFEFIKNLFGDQCTMSYRYSFEKKIKKIKGKHDNISQLDDYTMEYTINLMEVFGADNANKLKHQDKFVTVTTE